MNAQEVIKQMEGKINATVDALKKEFSTMRTSRATPSLLDRITVNYYGTETPLQHVASVSAPDAKSLVIQPWEKTMLQEIEKAIQKSDLGLNPVNDGTLIRLPIPMLTEERRNDLIKLAKKKTEEFRVAIRNLRRDANDALKALEKKSEISQDESKKLLDRVQKLTDEGINKLNALLAQKEGEIAGK